VLAPALLTVKMALGQRRPPARALAMGLARASRTVSVEAMAAPRTALDRAMDAHPRVRAKRRVTSLNACLACLAAADGEARSIGNRLRVHPHCRCTDEPVLRGVRERVHRPTGRDLFDALTPAQQNARYGAEKAELIRSDQVPFDALVHPQPMATVPDEITEAPLSALRP
jgi:hypothetical protein